MYFANDKSGGRIYIDDAKAGESFFCPACGKKWLLSEEIYMHTILHTCQEWTAIRGILANFLIGT